ncbi:UNVERIFIED_CONTAM: hypothetical protein RMT77_006146 [Armadillidium vulgare]
MRDKRYILYGFLLIAFLVLIIFQRFTIKFLSTFEEEQGNRLSKKENITTQISPRIQGIQKVKYNNTTERKNLNITKLVSKSSIKNNTLESKMYPNLYNCSNPEVSRRYSQKGRFWVFENYVRATKSYECHESITFATHGEFMYLENLVLLTSRWQGPISVAVYAPGNDFLIALKTIMHIRDCTSSDVKKYVTFHIFFENEHFPKMVPNIQETEKKQTVCNTKISSFRNKNYRLDKGLFYPVNIARNIAISNSATYFNLAADIELVPSVNIIPEFFKMLRKRDVSQTTNKRVFVLPVFEVKSNLSPPESKMGLVSMLQSKNAFLFHQRICYQCHLPPKFEEWKRAKYNPGLSVFHIGKRHKPHKTWEPFYIGTEEEPVFDERLTSEGRANKMTQAYAMCLLDYEYHILDNAFLVHKPGIKVANKTILRNKLTKKQNSLIFSTIGKEYKTFYGDRKDCHIMGPQ